MLLLKIPRPMNIQQTIIFGIHPVRELLRAKQRSVYQVFTTSPAPKAWQTVQPLIPRHVPVTMVSRDQLTARAGTADHQGVVALVGMLPLRSRSFDPKKQPFIVLLDGIQDPRNLGAIIRSASCTSVNGMVIPQKNSAPLQGIVCKSSAGLIEHMPIYQPTSSGAALQEIKAAGYAIYLATIGGKDFRTVAFQGPVCLVIGSEGSGISSALLNYGTAITIPQRSADISFNASVAAGILLFAIGNAIIKIE